MKILVVGSGGREHALCWAISKSLLCDKLYCAPGNPGIAAVAECLPTKAEDISGILTLCRIHQIEFVVVGPEIPLSLGLVDRLREAGITCFGPTQAAAELEASKGFMKDVCAAVNVPTAKYQRFTDARSAHDYVRREGVPIVIKADGLAAGKGVTVARTMDEAIKAIDDAMVKQVFGPSGNSLVIEEFMQGEEVSFFALCDGTTTLPFATAQDHKAAFDGDRGPNTGGMGAYSPAPIVSAAMQDRIMREIIEPTVKAMRDIGHPFTGILFAGLMITASGPRLIEFNVRFGDPETEAMLMRLKSDLLAVLYACSKGMLDAIDLQWYDRAALCVVMAAKGYPGDYEKGSVIKGLDKAAQMADGQVFHAGTAKNIDGAITANGGRVLAVTATGPTIEAAQTKAYQVVDQIDWPQGFCRRDIGWRAVAKDRVA